MNSIYFPKITLSKELESTESELIKASFSKKQIFIKKLDAKGIDTETLFIIIRNLKIFLIEELICDNIDSVYNEYLKSTTKVIIKNLDSKLYNNLATLDTETKDILTSVFILPIVLKNLETKDISMIISENNISIIDKDIGINIFNIFSSYNNFDISNLIEECQNKNSYVLTKTIAESLWGQGVLDLLINEEQNDYVVVNVIDDLLPVKAFSVIFSILQKE